MTKSMLLDKYPVFSYEIDKNESKFNSVDEILEFLKKKIEADPSGAFIAIFDQLKHTKSLNGEVMEGLLSAKNIIYCFGVAILNTKILAARPRSIGVCELKNSFIIECMDAPREVMQGKINSWIKELKI